MGLFQLKSFCIGCIKKQQKYTLIKRIFLSFKKIALLSQKPLLTADCLACRMRLVWSHGSGFYISEQDFDRKLSPYKFKTSLSYQLSLYFKMLAQRE